MRWAPLFLFTVGALSQQASITVAPEVARDSIVKLSGLRLATQTAQAQALPLPLELGGTTVTVTDASGTDHRAALFLVSPAQVDLHLSAQVATGAARLTVRAGDGTTSTANTRVEDIAPLLFEAAAALRSSSGGAYTSTPVAGGVDLGAESDRVLLVLFGTGIRGAVAVELKAYVGESEVPVATAAPHPETPGLDQVAIGPLPRTLAGRRDVPVQLVVDGIATNTITVSFPVDPRPGEWGRRAPLLESNSELSVAELDGKIYVLGGYPANRVSVAAVQVYDTATGAWSLTSPLPVPLNHSLAASVNGKLYLIGGQADANVAYVNTVYEYDPAVREWRSRAPMPTARSAGAAVVIDGKIYVAGGRPPRGADFAVYDPASDRWQALPDLPTQRNHLMAGAVGGKMYVVGGRFQGGFTSPQSDAVEVYDPVTGGWSPRAAMPKPRGGINGVVALGCIHVFGGEGSPSDVNGVYPDHDMYNPVTDTWSRVGVMPIPVHGVTGAAFVNGLIHLPGGGTSEGGSSGGTQHQVYRPNMNCP